MPSTVLSLARLTRIPNVFTAFADILLGYWMFFEFRSTSWGILGLLLGASSLLYIAGMVWNDVFDLEIDRVERPKRPLPSGAFSLQFAIYLAGLLTVAGLGLAVLVGMFSALVAVALAAAILTYNGWAKKTAAGPFVMGLCRTLNVLMGMSPALALAASEGAVASFPSALWLVPIANGVYIAGVTWFARQEATVSARGLLALGVGLMGIGLGIHGMTIASWPETDALVWPVAAILIALLGWKLFAALRDPVPAKVQAAVKTAVLGIVLVDAVLTLAFRGPVHGLIVASLLVPALLVGRWVYST